MTLHAFAVTLQDDPDAMYFVEQSSKRASGPGLHEFFAQWIVYEHEHDEVNDERTVVVGVKSKFPEAWKIATAMVALPFILVGLAWTAWMIPGIVILGMSFFASGTFRYWVFRIGLRRYGYEGKIKKLSVEDILAELMIDRRDAWHKVI